MAIKTWLPMLCATIGFLTIVGGSKQWDMFALCLTWPVTLCKFSEILPPHEKCSGPTTRWTIHGLWPSHRNGKRSPQNCTFSSPFDEREIQTLMDKMNKYWPNQFPVRGKYSFWKHEWETHGRCATVVKETETEHLYFNKTLSLRMEYDIDQILGAQGIKPGKKYKTSDIQNSVKKAVGGYPAITCGKLKEGVWVSQMLICMDRKFQTIDCPTKKAGLEASFNKGVPPNEPCPPTVVYPESKD